MSPFPTLGLIIALYTVYAIFRGEIYAKSGPGGRIVSREQSPEYFWVVVVIYFGLSASLVLLF